MHGQQTKCGQQLPQKAPHTQLTCLLPLQPSSEGFYPAVSARLTDIRRTMMRAPKVLSSWVTYRWASSCLQGLQLSAVSHVDEGLVQCSCQLPVC